MMGEFSYESDKKKIKEYYFGEKRKELYNLNVYLKKKFPECINDISNISSIFY